MLVCLIFLAAWASFSLPWLSGRVTIPYDAKAHFQAQLQFLARSLHEGQSPFWTPNVFGGSPQIADPQSLIFSPALLVAWLIEQPGFRTLDILVLAHLGFGGLCILMFFRDRGWHPAGAIVAALGFAFGAAAAWRIQHVGQVFNFGEFGFTLWMLSRALERASWRYGVLAGLGGAMMISTPDQVSLLGCYVLGGYVFWYWLDGAGRAGRLASSVRPLAASVVVGLLLAIVPLVLTLLFAASSQRAMISYDEAIRGSLHPASLLTALIGDLFGAGDPNVEYWGPSSMAWSPGILALSQNMSEVYFGILPVAAILTIGLTRGLLWAREIRFFTTAAFIMLLYGLGGYTPAFRWMYDVLPGVSGFRRPADAAFMIGGLFAVVGGYLVHRWVSGGLSASGPVRAALKLSLLVLLLALAVFAAVAHDRLQVATPPILLALALLGGGLVLLRLSEPLAARMPVAVTAVLAGFMVLDLGVNNGPNESTALPPAKFEVMNRDTSNRTIALLKGRLAANTDLARRDRVELVGVGFEWPNLGMIHGFDHVLGYNPLRLKDFVDATGARDTIAGPDQRRFTPLFPSYRSLLSDMLGLRWIAASIPIEQIDPTLRPGDLRFVTQTEDGYIYENPQALPRVQFVRDWQVADFEALTGQGNWPRGFDPRRSVLLEDNPETIEAPRTTGPAAVSIVSYDNTRVEIAVTSPDPGFVVLNDVWHRWWTVTIDGDEADVLKANVLFRAVQVPAGAHRIVFEFRPIGGAIAELRERLVGEEPEAPSEETP